MFNQVDLLAIEREYAPLGKCQCPKIAEEELGCPFCNPMLREAWKKSCELEKQIQ